MRFPLKVYHMLECGKYNHIINWLPDGASFSILDEALLVRDVLPFYCPGARYETFIRQLNKYGMETLEKRRKSDIGRIFSSALFIRGREDLLLTMQRTGAKPSSKAKAEVAPSGPNKRSKSDNDSPPSDSSIIGSHLSGPSFHNLRSFHQPTQNAPALELTEAPAPSHISTDSAGLWLAQKVVVTRVTEHIKYAFIPYDLLSEPLHSSALQTAVTNSIFTSEQLLTRDTAYHSSNSDKIYESANILESSFSPVEYVIALSTASVTGSFPSTNTQPAVHDSAGESAQDWSQQMLQSLGVSSSKDAIIVTGSTTLDSAITDITAAVTAAAVSTDISSFVQSTQTASYEEGQTGTTIDTAGKDGTE